MCVGGGGGGGGLGRGGGGTLSHNLFNKIYTVDSHYLEVEGTL